MKRLISSLLFFALLLGVWHALVALRVWSPVLLPGPLAVGRYLLESSLDGTLFQAVLVTMRRLLVGYGMGMLLGVPIGLFTARFRMMEDTVGVLALGLQALPSVCWVPLALLWFGQSEGAMFFVVLMGSLWSIIISTDNGVRNVPPIYARAARTMGSRQFHTWTRVILPASLPFMISGMRQGWAFSWRSLMAAEIFVTILTGFGLGQLLENGRNLHQMEQVVGVMLTIVIVGLLADKIFFSPIERLLHRRWGTGRL